MQSGTCSKIDVSHIDPKLFRLVRCPILIGCPIFVDKVSNEATIIKSLIHNSW